MTQEDRPQLYLIAPPDADASAFPDTLARVLDAVPVACLRLSLASRDEGVWTQVGDAVRAVAHARDVPVVLGEHWQLAERLGLDGVHLQEDLRHIRAARKALGPDAIVGAGAGASRHAGLTAGEAGADYVAFSPCAPSPFGDGAIAEADLFAWWSEMIELPVVAEGGLTPDLVAALAPVSDFFAIGPEIWTADDPAQALKSLAAPVLE
ncbi:MAG: thiamine phosphate synthase [Pseudomonadota bacterium]